MRNELAAQNRGPPKSFLERRPGKTNFCKKWFSRYVNLFLLPKNEPMCLAFCMLLRLASGSPRRVELLREMGVRRFEVTPAEVDECLDGEGCVAGVARMNAERKAGWVAERYPADVCLGADTVVGLGGRIFHKPKDLREAAAMLREFSGKEHIVVTGLALRSVKGNINEVHAICTKVFFNELTDQQIAEYFQIVNPLDKSGSYAIQQGNVVRRYEGSLTNVVGLPTEFLEERLKALGMWDYLAGSEIN